MPGLAMYPTQDNPNLFFTHEEVVQSQMEFRGLFVGILNEGKEVDTMHAASYISHFINHVVYVERATNLRSPQPDELTYMVGYSGLERGIALPGTMLDGRNFEWAYEMGKLNQLLSHMGLGVESSPGGYYAWSPKTRKFLGERGEGPRGLYQAYENKLIDYPALAYLADYLSMQIVQLAGRTKEERDQKILLFLSAVCKLGNVELTCLMETRHFLDRESAKLLIGRSASDVGISLKDYEPQPFPAFE